MATAVVSTRLCEAAVNCNSTASVLLTSRTGELLRSTTGDQKHYKWERASRLVSIVKRRYNISYRQISTWEAVTRTMVRVRHYHLEGVALVTSRVSSPVTIWREPRL